MLSCNEVAASRKIIDMLAPWLGVAVGRERSGIGLLFLALFGAGLFGVAGKVTARLAATDWFMLSKLSGSLVGLDIAMSVPFATGAL